MADYKKIDADEYRRIFCVADLHGCYDLLCDKLDRLNFDTEKDLLISVGDLVDRGKQNIECLHLLREPWFKAVLGNHEQMLLDTRRNRLDPYLHIRNGGSWLHGLTLAENDFLSEIEPLIEDLPLIIEVNNGLHKTVIAHADYPYKHYYFNKPVLKEDIIWSRDRVNAYEEGDLIPEPITGADQFIFGHTVYENGIREWANMKYIDGGAVFTKHLNIIALK